MTVTNALTKRHVYPVDVSEVEDALANITTKLGCSKAEAIRDAVTHYAEYLEGIEVVEYRSLPLARVKKEVEKYIRGKTRVRADEISDALRIDMTDVNEALMQLWAEKEVAPE